MAATPRHACLIVRRAPAPKPVPEFRADAAYPVSCLRRKLAHQAAEGGQKNSGEAGVKLRTNQKRPRALLRNECLRSVPKWRPLEKTGGLWAGDGDGDLNLMKEFS
ncbi:hypothetical protein ACOMHN_011488 [Nucella lapillus]